MRRGSGSDAGYTALLMCLVFLRRCACREWRELARIIRAESVNLQPAALLRRIGDLTDEALRECGVVPGARYAIERLRPQSTRHIIQIIDRCDQLGTHAFVRLLDLFAADSRLGAADSFTPREVALLMGRLVAADADPERPVYDPYMRGGELLRAAREVRHPADRVPLHGDSPSPVQPFAGMGIVLHDDRAVEIRRGSSTPWDVENRKIAAGTVLLNPPFNMPVGAGLPDTVWPFGAPPADKSDFAWLQHAVTCLAPGARAAVLMPRHAGASSDRGQRNIRENMVEKGSVQAIVMLPGRLFPASSANVNLWVVGPAGDSPGRILFIDATRMLNRSKTGPVLSSGAAEQIAELYRDGHRLALGEQQQLTDGGRAIMSGIDAIRGTGYSLDPADYLGGNTRTHPEVRPEHGTSLVHDSLGALSEQMTEAHRIDAEVERLMTVSQSQRSITHGWARVRLAEICELKAGPSFTRLGLKERMEDGTIPVVMPRHLRDRRIATAEIHKVSEETARKLDKFWLATGDILCIRSGAITEPAIAEEQHAGWLYGTNLIRLRIEHPSQVDASYLLGFLSLPEVQEWIRGQSTRTATSSISTESLGNLMVTCPPIEIQRQISAAFNTFDAHIAIHRQIVKDSAVTRTKLGGSLIEGTLTLR
jgi:type I restriction enzyme M protein